MLSKVNRSHVSKHQLYFQVSTLEQSSQKKLGYSMLTTSTVLQYQSDYSEKALRRQKPNSWSLVSRNSLEAFETLCNNWRGDTWSLARDNNNKDNLWCLFCKRVWGHTVTQGASLLLQIPFRSWQFGERRGSCYLCSCTDGWEKDTADIPYSKLNEELNRAK